MKENIIKSFCGCYTGSRGGSFFKKRPPWPPEAPAKETRIDQTRISEIIKGKRGISIDTALRFAKFFGNSPEFWINIQNHYDLEEKKSRLAKELEEIKTYVFTQESAVQAV